MSDRGSGVGRGVHRRSTASAASERALLDQFFAASRLRDRTALARFSTVVFEPRTDGIVEEFVVLESDA